MNKFKTIITFSLVITLPLSIYFILWIYNSISLHSKFESLSTWVPNRLYTAGVIEYKSLKNDINSNLGINKKSDINILINKKSLNELVSYLPKSSFIDKKAILFMNNKVYKGKTRLRGDNYYHWLFPQTSWRFKSSKKDLANGIHKLNFIIPKGYEILNNHLSYKLAKNLDLLAPDSRLATLSINNKNNGIKIIAEQIDEGFLRNNNRMPNDIYKGDIMGSKKIIGATIDMFHTPSIWDKSSYNNHYLRDSMKPLETLLLDNQYTLLDYKSFSSFSSFIDLIHTYHYDNSHNWILYYDNYFEKMYPIVWDPVGWWEGWEKKENINIVSSSLLEALHKDYQFLYTKFVTMKEFFNTKEEFIELIDQEIEIAKSKILDNEYTFRMDSRNIMNHSESFNKIEEFRTRILNRLRKVENFFVGQINRDNYAYSLHENKIRLSINGNKMITKIIINTKYSNQIKNVHISYILDEKKIRKSLRNSILLNKNNLTIKMNLLANAEISDTLTFKEATYDIDIEELDLNTIEAISLEFLNLKNQVITINKLDYIEQRKFTNVHNIISESLDTTPIIYSGIKSLSGFNTIKRNIIIEPGTKIIFDQNATLKILGKVTAIGTKENPIIFQAKDKSKSWNTFALKDAKANGSVFKHCIFKDGSGDKGDLYEYTAMFSVHNVKDLLVEDCEFYDSHRTDDMVHVIYSDATFKNTKFIRSLSDALDVDISNLVVDNCEFIDSGNDSIDLMTTNAMVTNTKFTNSKDKGISIGEGSNLLAMNNFIEGSEIGMQSKDTSKAYIYNTSFIGNKKAIDAYHKNWRYSEGGTIYLDKCIFEKNKHNATVGKKSKVVINDSSIDTPENFNIKSIQKEKIKLSNDDLIIYDLKDPLFKNKSHLIVKERRGYHE